MDVGASNFQFTLDNPEKPARTIRYPKTAELHLDSLDRYNAANVIAASGIPTISTNPNYTKLWGTIVASSNTNSTNNCLIQTKRNLIYGYMSRIALTQFSLQYNVPTIVAGYNDLMLVNAGGLYFSYTMPQGYYNLTTLAAAIQVGLRTMTGGGLGTATVVAPTSQTSASPLTSVSTGFFVTAGAPATMFFAYAGNPGGIDTNDAQDLRIARFNRLIGVNRAGAGYGAIPDTTAVPSPFDASQVRWATATLGTPNFRYTDYVDIVSQALTNYKDTKDANSAILSPGSVIGRIWLTEYPMQSHATGTLGWAQDGLWNMGPLSFVKNWSNPNWSQWSPNSAINSVDISLLDMFGVPLPWNSTYNTEWQATVTVTE
jgi:hypothetical protein